MSKEQCRHYLQITGKPYPKSGCLVCGSAIKNQCKYLASPEVQARIFPNAYPEITSDESLREAIERDSRHVDRGDWQGIDIDDAFFIAKKYSDCQEVKERHRREFVNLLKHELLDGEMLQHNSNAEKWITGFYSKISESLEDGFECSDAAQQLPKEKAHLYALRKVGRFKPTADYVAEYAEAYAEYMLKEQSVLLRDAP